MSLRGHEIFLLVGQNDNASAFDKELSDLCQKIYTYKIPIFSSFFFLLRSVFSPKIYPALKFQSKNFKEVVNNIISEVGIDTIWVNFSFMADMLPDGLNEKISVILDQQESERLVYYGYLKRGNLLQRIFAIINIVKLRRFEERAFSKVDILLCVSHDEAAIAKKYARKEIKILVVPNGVDESFFGDLKAFVNNGSRIIFCANLAIRRNVEAAVWFTGRIFPKVRAQIKDAEFWIVGSWPSDEVLRLNSVPGVRVIGMVEDIKKYYKEGRVFVAPYHFGAGTKLKVFEAMAIGIPVVSTDIGAQGIEVTNDKDIIIANNENDFYNSVVELLSNRQKAEQIAVAGQNLIKQKYTWNKIVSCLEQEILKLLNNKGH